MFKTGLYVRSLIATDLLTPITFPMAKPLADFGTALPLFMPPLLAAIISIVLSYNQAAAIAYIFRTLGTLIGAEILHPKDIHGLGAPIASIGGAGAFDGIFLNGILGVLLSTLLT